MTQPQHPFTNLPDELEISPSADGQDWFIADHNSLNIAQVYRFGAYLWKADFGFFVTAEHETANAALHSGLDRVRSLAKSIGMKDET